MTEALFHPVAMACPKFSLGDRVRVSSDYFDEDLRGALGAVVRPNENLVKRYEWRDYWRVEAEYVYWIEFATCSAEVGEGDLESVSSEFAAENDQPAGLASMAMTPPKFSLGDRIIVSICHPDPALRSLTGTVAHRPEALADLDWCGYYRMKEAGTFGVDRIYWIEFDKAAVVDEAQSVIEGAEVLEQFLSENPARKNP